MDVDGGHDSPEKREVSEVVFDQLSFSLLDVFFFAVLGSRFVSLEVVGAETFVLRGEVVFFVEVVVLFQAVKFGVLRQLPP